jgi:hypothetical protein
MGPRIIVPIVLLLIVVPIAFTWARRLRNGISTAVEITPPPSARLTSNALRTLQAPPWRVVYEIAADKLGGIEHVLIGPPGIYAMQTSMEPMPAPSEPDPRAMGRAAIARGPLDDALRRCAMDSSALVTVHWGVDPTATGGPALEVLPGAIAVDGRRIAAWTEALPAALTPAQVDLAWQTVLTSIGRPDPLA